MVYIYFRKCLHNHIITSDGAEVLCPFHYELACGGYITEAEICQVWFVFKFYTLSLYVTQIHALQNFTHTAIVHICTNIKLLLFKCLYKYM